MSEVDRSENTVIPIMVLLVSLIFGGHVVWNRPFETGMAYVWIIVLVLSIGGIAYVAWGFKSVRQENDLHAAVDWLFDGLDDEHPNSESAETDTDTERTPPPTERKKNELYFERANQRCEWCEERVDSPDVHHIEPRSKGGSNSPRNLIVLCPTCHRKADRGAISKSKLKYKAREQIGELES